MPVSGSPGLIAAVHVLLRLPSPRHPPRALSSLTCIPKARINARGQGSLQEPPSEPKPPQTPSRAPVVATTLRLSHRTAGLSPRDYGISRFLFSFQGFEASASSLVTTAPCSGERSSRVTSQKFRVVKRTRLRLKPRPEPQDVGADRDRTGDPRLAKPVLSQLSYNPVASLYADSPALTCLRLSARKTLESQVRAVGLVRFELTTSPLSGVRSNHLSYSPSFEGCRSLDRATYCVSAAQSRAPGNFVLQRAYPAGCAGGGSVSEN